MKKLILIIFLMISQFSISQKNVVFENKGVIFTEGYEFYLFKDLKRITPSLGEIKELEKLLSQQIKEININKPNQKKSPLIHRNLKKYKRQYVGYYNGNGERIIYINFLWKGYKGYDVDGKQIEPWKTEWLQMFDGGSQYWQIKYNSDFST